MLITYTLPTMPAKATSHFTTKVSWFSGQASIALVPAWSSTRVLLVVFESSGRFVAFSFPMMHSGAVVGVLGKRADHNTGVVS